MGGKGDDKLYGEAGQNTFYFSDGDGDDTVYMGKGSDKIVFDPSLTGSKAPMFRQEKNNLVIEYGTEVNGKKNSVTIMNYFTSKTPSLKTVEYCGIEYNISDIVVKGSLDKYSYGVPVNRYIGNEKSNLMLSLFPMTLYIMSLLFLGLSNRVGLSDLR